MKTFNIVKCNIGFCLSLRLKIILIISFIAVFSVCFLHQYNETNEDCEIYMQNPDIFKGTICDSLITRIKRRYLFGSLDDIENIDFDTNACTANDSLYKDNYKTTYTSKQDNLNINKETEEERTTYNIVYKDSPVTTILLVIITALLVMKFFGKKIMQRCSHNKKTGTNVEMTQSDEETAVGTRHEV